jgi:uncharacterized protein (TIGR02145 family)
MFRKLTLFFIVTLTLFCHSDLFSQTIMTFHRTFVTPTGDTILIKTNINPAKVDSMIVTDIIDHDSIMYFSPMHIDEVSPYSAKLGMLFLNYFFYNFYNNEPISSGFYWSQNSNPTSQNSEIYSTGGAVWLHEIENLTPNTQYYARAFVQYLDTTHLSPVYSFQTLEEVQFSSLPGNGATDANGNFYPSIILPNGQEWLTENLRSTSYSNGDPIPFLALNYVLNISQNLNNHWANLNSGVYTYYYNNIDYQEVYGNLYNFHVIADSRNICPTGWHVPTNLEWLDLSNYFYGSLTAGYYLKSNSPDSWSYNPGIDAIGFNAIGSGLINTGPFQNGGFSMTGGQEKFKNLNYQGYWWMTAVSNPLNITHGYATMSVNSNQLQLFPFYSPTNPNGMSIRCIKD